MSDLIDLETCLILRKALMIGLSSFGEIERLDDAYSIRVEIAGDQIHDSLCPLHPTGAADTVGHFADAMSAVDLIESKLREAAEAAPASD